MAEAAGTALAPVAAACSGVDRNRCSRSAGIRVPRRTPFAAEFDLGPPALDRSDNGQGAPMTELARVFQPAGAGTVSGNGAGDPKARLCSPVLATTREKAG